MTLSTDELSREENPFDPPRVPSWACGIQSFGPYAFDDDLLIVHDRTELPPLCVVTGERVAGPPTKKSFHWCNNLLLLPVLLVSNIFGLLLYFAIRKRCTISVAVSRDVKVKYTRRRRIKLLIAIVSFFSLPFASGYVLAAVLCVFLGAVVTLPFGNFPLSTVKFRDGRFWLKGTTQEFRDAAIAYEATRNRNSSAA